MNNPEQISRKIPQIIRELGREALLLIRSNVDLNPNEAALRRLGWELLQEESKNTQK